VQAAPQWTVVGGARVDRITTENVVSGADEATCTRARADR
jgi:hypothetical protein